MWLLLGVFQVSSARRPPHEDGRPGEAEAQPAGDEAALRGVTDLGTVLVVKHEGFHLKKPGFWMFRFLKQGFFMVLGALGSKYETEKRTETSCGSGVGVGFGVAEDHDLGKGFASGLLVNPARCCLQMF